MCLFNSSLFGVWYSHLVHKWCIPSCLESTWCLRRSCLAVRKPHSLQQYFKSRRILNMSFQSWLLCSLVVTLTTVVCNPFVFAYEFSDLFVLLLSIHCFHSLIPSWYISLWLLRLLYKVALYPHKSQEYVMPSCWLCGVFLVHYWSW